MWAGTVILALALAIGLFFVVPVGLTSLIKDQLGSSFLFWLVEGIVRTAIFLGYLVLLSRLRDLRRVFEYHGAEHKTISCYEAGLELTPGERAALLPPAPALRHELPAHRHDRRDLRLRARSGCPRGTGSCSTRIVGVPLIAGISLRDHQVRRAATAAGAGCGR